MNLENLLNFDKIIDTKANLKDICKILDTKTSIFDKFQIQMM